MPVYQKNHTAKKRNTKRDKTHFFPAVRVTKEQRNSLDKEADRLGVSVGSVILLAVLNLPPQKARKSPTLDQKQLALLLAKLGRLGGSIHQIAKAANYKNEIPFQETLEDWKELREMKDVLRNLLNGVLK